MTIDQQMAVLFPPIEMPADVRERVLSLVQVEARRLRVARRLRRVVVVAVVAILLSMASGASAQVRCDPCPLRYATWVPIIHASNVEGQEVVP